MVPRPIDQRHVNLAAYINDDNKLVTYKWLSKELHIHVNLAKQILWDYWKKNEEKTNLVATHLLMGSLEDGSIRIEVVRECNRIEAKKKFTKIISEHIYSLQKSLPDLELLALSVESKFHQPIIRCNESKLRTDHEWQVLHWGNALAAQFSEIQSSSAAKTIKPPIATPQKSANQPIDEKSKKSAEKTKNSAFNNLFSNAKKQPVKTKSSSSSVSAKPKSDKNFFSNFTRSNRVSDESSEKSEVPEAMKTDRQNDSLTKDRQPAKEESPKRPDKAKLAEVGSRNNSKNQNSSTNSKGIKNESKSSVAEISLIDTTDHDGEKYSKDIDDNSKKLKSAKNNKSNGEKRKKNGNSKAAVKSQKKRKRILIVDSDEESSNDDSLYGMEPQSPEKSSTVKDVEPCVTPPLIKHENGRRKKRKLIDQNYTDEDGFLVTSKEYVYESCSDKEEETVQVPDVTVCKSEPAAKTSNKQKQASLLNFFRKT